jgi:DNA-binding NarL/FixJ family response regulator
MLSPAKQLTVLLVSQPGIMHNTLHSILQSLPNVEVSDSDGALSAYGSLEKNHTDALVIDANIALGERLALLARVKKEYPHVRSLVLTTTARHHALLTSAGADKVLQQNCSPQEIEAALFADNLDHKIGN